MKFQKMLLVLLMGYIVSVFSITPDINAAIKDVFSSLANVELMMEDANEDTTDKRDTGDVLDADILEHDCTNVRKISRGRFYKDQKKYPQLARINVKRGKLVTKWNHAYGIPVVSWGTLSDEAVKRACYLLRYLFADNEWLRRYYYHQKFYFYGNTNGGTCCPPFMGNQGLSCRCNTWVPYSLTPAHEAGHQFLRSVQKATVDGKMKMPEFTNTLVWNFTQAYGGSDPWKEFLWNAWKKDTLNGKTKWPMGDHYFLESGQDQWLGLNEQGRLREESRASKEQNNPELVKMMKTFWPCNNSYVMVCKDAAYNYKAGPAQILKIGKADPNDPSKMICRDDLDQAELSTRGDRIDPTDDDYHDRTGDSETAKRNNHANYCRRALKDAGWITDRAFDNMGKGRCAPWDHANWIQHKYSKSSSDRSIVGKSLNWCRNTCTAMEECTFFTYTLAYKKWCYLWSGATCAPQKYKLYVSYKKVTPGHDLDVGEVDEALREGNYEGGKDIERNWYLQHCCAKTAKFPYAMK